MRLNSAWSARKDLCVVHILFLPKAGQYQRIFTILASCLALEIVVL
jgi:hypothetical protein